MDNNILRLILVHTSSFSDYKSFRLVSKSWRNVLGELFLDGGKFVNHLTTFIKLAENTDRKFKRWDLLSENKNININLVKMFNNKKWNYGRLSINTGIKFSDIINNPDIPWNINHILACRKDISWEFIKQNIGKRLPPDIYIESRPAITWDIITNNPDYNWNKYNFSNNPNLTWEIVRDHHMGWFWLAISSKKFITWEIVQNNPDYPWNMQGLSINPNITWKIIQDNSHMNWDYDAMSRNTNITIDIIMNNQHLNWDIQVFLMFHENYTITKEFLEKYDKRYDFYSIFLKAKLSLDFIIKTDIVWDFMLLMRNPNICKELTYNNYIKYPELYKKGFRIEQIYDIEKIFTEWKGDIDYRRLSFNPNLTWRMIIENIDKPWYYGIIVEDGMI